MLNLNEYGVKELSQSEKVETNGGLKLRLSKWWHYALVAVAVVALAVL